MVQRLSIYGQPDVSDDGSYVDYDDHMKAIAMCESYHEAKIKTLEAQVSTLRVENMHLKQLKPGERQ